MNTPQVRAAVVVNNMRTEMRMFLPASVGLNGAQKAAGNLSELLGMATQLTFHDPFNHYCIVAKEVDAEGNITEKSILAIDTGIHDDMVQTANERIFSAHIPRPPNSWILYRQHHSREIHRTRPDTPASAISGIVSQMWRNEAPDVKAEWQRRADDASRQHKERHPGYRYRASRKKSVKAITRSMSPAGSGQDQQNKQKLAAPSPSIALREYLANMGIETLALAL